MTVSAQFSRPSALVRLYNGLWGMGDRLGVTWPSIEQERLMETAERITGLHEWGDGPFRLALESVLTSAQSGPGLTPFGRMAVRHILLRSLANKLKLENFKRSRPELLDSPVDRPVFIVGWYRSGTTLLHRLLADLPGFRAPEAWELHFPVPGPGLAALDRRRRLGTTGWMLWLARQAVPHLDDVHTLRARSAEESTLLLDNELCAVYAIHAFGAMDHGRWLIDTDLHGAYASMKAQLQILSGPQDPRRWVLKCPFSMWHLETLLDIFPDAVVIRTHRNVTESLPSVCSLSAILQAGFLRNVDLHGLGRFWSDFYWEGLKRSRRARSRHPESLFLDVDYRSLAADPEGTARWVREQLDLDEAPTLSPPLRVPPGKRPYRSTHHYSLEQYGLDPQELHDRFGPLLAPLPGARRAPEPMSKPRPARR